MSKIYSVAPSGVAERVAHLVKLFHSDLKDAGVKFDLLSVSDDDPDCDTPLKLHGYPCAAVVRAVDVKGRAMGRGDVEIVIDEALYISMPDAQKDALLDHELEHVELQINPKKGRVKLDCCGRPMVKMRLHDIQLGHFISIAERHGAASLEVQQMTRVFLSHKQTLFSFAMDQDLSKRLEAATSEPSAKVREIAKDILNASPAVQAAARNLVSNLRKDGLTMTVKSGGHETIIR